MSRKRQASPSVEPGRREELRRYANVFSTLLYLDDAIAWLLEEYEKRPDYARTIFIRCSSVYAWYSQITRMITPASSAERPNSGGSGYF